MKNYRSWDYSWPTLTEERRFTDRNTYASDDSFFEVIRNHNHGFTWMILDKLGVFAEEGDDQDVVLYGGSLLDVILDRENHINDWDLRLVGKKYAGDEDACVRRA